MDNSHISVNSKHCEFFFGISNVPNNWEKNKNEHITHYKRSNSEIFSEDEVINEPGHEYKQIPNNSNEEKCICFETSEAADWKAKADSLSTGALESHVLNGKFVKVLD